MNWQVVRGLSLRGHRCRALAPMASNADGKTGALADALADVDVTRFPVAHFVVSEDRFAETYLEAEGAEVIPRQQALVKDDRPDLVIFGREIYLLHVLEAFRAQNIPTVLIAHDGSLPQRYLTGRFTQAVGSKLLQHFHSVTRVVAVAAHLLNSWKKVGLRNIMLIPNAIDGSTFSPCPKDLRLLNTLQIRKDATVAMHASNLKAVKRPMDVVLSAREALEHNRGLVYVVVGDGIFRARMEEMCRKEQIAECFRFTGWVPRDSVPALLNLADMVIMPSEEEGRCLVCLEAQACSKLVLAADIPAARDMIVDGKNGLLFRLGDISELTQKTLHAAANPALRLQIGAQARQSALSWSLEDMVSAYESVIQEVASQKTNDTERA